LACSFSTAASAAFALSGAAALPENTPVSPSMACRLQSPTMVW